MSRSTHFTDELDRVANKRVSRKMGWFIHAFVFVLFNLGHMALAALSGRHSVMAPLLGWALALFVHGLIVFVFMPGNGLRERMVSRERDRLTAINRATAMPGPTAQTAQRDPW